MFANNIFITSLLSIITFEVLSLLNYFYFPNLPIVFFIIVIIAVVVSLYKLEYGIYILLAELFIGGKGYLFSMNLESFTVSIRMALFIIVLSVWLAKFLISNFSPYGGSPEGRQFLKKFPNPQFPKRTFILNSKFLILFFLIIIHGIVFGFIQNSFIKAFLDANAWIFFLLIFVFLDTIKKENIQNILTILFVGAIWIGIKTAYVLFLFSRHLSYVGDPFYKWIRDTGVGEITSMGGDMYRIFFQSHIYSLIAAIIILSLFFLGQKFDKKFLFIAIFAFYFSTLSILISQSRSFWVGGGVAFIGLLIYSFSPLQNRLQSAPINSTIYEEKFFVTGFIKKINYKKIFLLTLLFFIIIFSQLSVIKIITGNFGNLFAARLENPEEEAAGSSRLNQLQPLFEGIKKHPILGSGFGTEITYKSNDPRILKTHPDGMYTTYAFEWGYLDIWLKIGFIGLLIYLFIILKIFAKLIQSNNPLQISLAAGLVALAVTNIFSPYLNHPLGIGYILLLASLGYNGDIKK